MERRALITGASRGLGLEFVRQWLDRGDTVFALARRPERSAGLEELARAHGERLALVECDVADDASVTASRRAVARRTDRLDLLVNNAGVYSKAEVALESLDFGELRSVFEVNVIGALRTAREFLPLLRQGRFPRLVQITSLMGSIDDNHSGGTWAYRISKAALNMATRNLAHALQKDGITAVALHPGWVRTDMGGKSAPLSPGEAVAGLIATIDRLTAQQSGGFFGRDGAPCPW